MIVQTNHATQKMFSALPIPQGTPNIVAIGVPNVAALNRVLAKLKANHIVHYPFIEPDNDLGFTAITTVPLDNEQREVLKNYRLFTEAALGNQLAWETTTLPPFSRSSRLEHSASKAEDVGCGPYRESQCRSSSQ